MPRFDQASGAVERVPTDPNVRGEDGQGRQWSGPFWLWEEGTEQESFWGSNSGRTPGAGAEKRVDGQRKENNGMAIGAETKSTGRQEESMRTNGQNLHPLHPPWNLQMAWRRRQK